MLGTNGSPWPANKHTDLPGFVNVSRLNTYLAPLGVNDTRTVGTNETRLCLVLERVDNLRREVQSSIRSRDDRSSYPDLVRLGDALGNTNDQRNLIVDGFNNGVSSCWRRNVDHGRVRLSLLDSLHETTDVTRTDLSIPKGDHQWRFTHLLHRPEHRQSKMNRSGLFGRNAPNHVRSICQGLLDVERSLFFKRTPRAGMSITPSRSELAECN